MLSKYAPLGAEEVSVNKTVKSLPFPSRRWDIHEASNTCKSKDRSPILTSVNI